jgi:hypothetical protein
VSGDRSSALRKRALRRLSHEHYPDCSALYEQVLSETPGLTRYQARGRAWTRLRHQFPDRYLELFALEQGGIRTDVPPDPRGKSWQRACVRLADLRKTAYLSRFAEFRAQGVVPPKAYDRAVGVVSWPALAVAPADEPPGPAAAGGADLRHAPDRTRGTG